MARHKRRSIRLAHVEHQVKVKRKKNERNMPVPEVKAAEVKKTRKPGTPKRSTKK